jgi:hypothetical protein
MTYSTVQSATRRLNALVALYAKSFIKGDRLIMNLLISGQMLRVQEIASLIVK